MGTRRYGVRPPAVAGLFYSDSAEALESELDAMLAEARMHVTLTEARPPKALVVPHAGYRYSGRIAATAYSLLPPRRSQADPTSAADPMMVSSEQPSVAIILGPPHRVPVRGFALPDNSAMRTPLGVVPIDEDIAGELLHNPRVELNRDAHAAEHSLEVQLPFLQAIYGMHLRVVPVLVGDAAPELVAGLLEDFWERENVVFIFSSDLCHYLDYDQAKQRDERTLQVLTQGNRPKLEAEDACGYRGLNGLMEFSRTHQLQRRLLTKGNSGDRSGPRDRVVGYGAVGVWA